MWGYVNSALNLVSSSPLHFGVFANPIYTPSFSLHFSQCARFVSLKICLSLRYKITSFDSFVISLRKFVAASCLAPKLFKIIISNFIVIVVFMMAQIINIQSIQRPKFYYSMVSMIFLIHLIF